MAALPSRNRRRSEKKLFLLPYLLLLLLLCGGSFSAGVWYGRGLSSAPPADAASMVRMAVEVPAANSAPEVPKGPTATENLTFFDTLAKGDRPPLGSGINLPPASDPPRSEPAAQPSSRPVTETRTVQAPQPQPPSVAVAPSPATVDGSYLVQAASFAKSEEAQALQARLARKNYPVFVQSADLGERGTWYRVMVGPLDGSAAAERMAARLQSEEKLSVMIRKR